LDMSYGKLGSIMRCGEWSDDYLIFSTYKYD
jgi:hypothetical protein